MSNIRKLKVERIVDRLKEVLEASTMERADFDGCGDKEKTKTSFIKERTRLYRQSWLIQPLEKAISDLQEELKR